MSDPRIESELKELRRQNDEFIQKVVEKLLKIPEISPLEFVWTVYDHYGSVVGIYTTELKATTAKDRWENQDWNRHKATIECIRLNIP